jgi:hypothetical protein
VSSLPPRRSRQGLGRSRAAAVRVRPEHASSTWLARQGVRPGLFKAAAAPWASYPRHPPPAASCAASRRNPSRCRFRCPAVDAASSSRSTPRDAQGGEEPAGVVCRRPRAPRRPRNLAGLRRRTEQRRRMERRRRGVSAVRTATVDFLVVRPISWCYLCTKPSPSA